MTTCFITLEQTPYSSSYQPREDLKAIHPPLMKRAEDMTCWEGRYSPMGLWDRVANFTLVMGSYQMLLREKDVTVSQVAAC